MKAENKNKEYFPERRREDRRQGERRNRTFNVYKTIEVNILSFLEGTKTYNEVKAIRIKSKKYNLLIMCDYLPVLGEIEGSIEFVTDEKDYRVEDIQGYFCHKNNVFTLLVREN